MTAQELKTVRQAWWLSMVLVVVGALGFAAALTQIGGTP